MVTMTGIGPDSFSAVISKAPIEVSGDKKMLVAWIRKFWRGSTNACSVAEDLLRFGGVDAESRVTTG